MVMMSLFFKFFLRSYVVVCRERDAHVQSHAQGLRDKEESIARLTDEASRLNQKLSLAQEVFHQKAF